METNNASGHVPTVPLGPSSNLFTVKTTEAVVPSGMRNTAGEELLGFGRLEASTSLNACVLWVAKTYGVDVATLWTQYDLGAWHVHGPGKLMERRLAMILTIEEPAPPSIYKYSFEQILCTNEVPDGHASDLA